METTTTHPGYPSLTPYLIVEGAEKLIEFLQQAFDAKVVYRQMHADNKVRHVELHLGNSMVMISDATADYPALKSMFYVYLDHVDQSYQRAIAAGATSLQTPKDQEYGHRTSGVIDQHGNQWWIASEIKKDS